MSFSGYTCWETSEVKRVTNPVALGLDDATFAAIHTPMHLTVQRGVKGEERLDYDETALIEDLLSKERNHQFFAVLGEPGTGKSHLIRWVYTQVASSSDRHVVLIPRARTNLRGVISILLEAFEENERFDPYRERLESATTPPTAQAGRARLLDSLAHVIQYEYAETSNDADGLQKHAAKHLPDLFREPYFRKEYWLSEDGVLARLYNGALGSADQGIGQGTEQTFDEEDLPQDLDGVDAGNKDVLRFYNQLQQRSQIREAALEVLNRHLSTAVQQMLNFTGEDLFELFLDLRHTLFEQDKELVLLIEDVARQQGLRGAILESLIVEPREIEKPLCTLRSVVGITPYPFKLLAGNIRGRITGLVNLDVAEATDREAMLLPMAARYMNASRLSEERLRQWNGEDNSSAPPSACTNCPYKTECHAAFGEVDGYGLYPFNRTALRQMYQRKDPDGFNPRVLLRDVLDWPLVQGKKEIDKGVFPSSALHEHFGGTKEWATDSLRDVQRKDPVNQQRRFALLDLWSTERRLVDLPGGVHTAFDLPEMGDAGIIDPPGPKPDEPEPKPEEPKPYDGGVLGEADQNIVESLRAWANGEAVQMRVVNKVRRRLRSRLYHYIDWDAERLFRTELYGNRVFENESINLDGQAGSTGNAEVNFVLPLKGHTRADVAEGVHALLLYEHYGKWDFDGAPEKLIAYGSLLEQLAEETVRQLRQPPGHSDPWSPGFTAAEVLRLGARAAGEPSASRTTPADRLDALFAELPGEEGSPEAASRPWKKMQKAFAQRRDDLLDLLKAYHICPKGGQASNWHLDSADLIEIIGRIDLKPRTVLPEDQKDLPKRLRPLHKPVMETESMLRPAIEAEEDRWAAWVDRVAQHLGGPDELGATKEAVRGAFKSLEEAGALRANPSEKNDFRRHSLRIRAEEYRHLWTQAHDVAERIAEEEGTSGELSSRLRELGYLNRKELDSTADGATKYVTIAEEILERSNQWLEEQVQQVAAEDDVEKLLESFRGTLFDLERELLVPDGAIADATDAEAVDGKPKTPTVDVDAEGTKVDPEEEVLPAGVAVRLAKLGERARVLAERYQRAREVAGMASDLRSLQNTYEEHLGALVDLRKSREALRAVEVTLDPVMRGEDLAQVARGQLSLLEERPKEYLGASYNALRNQFLNRLEPLIENRRKRTIANWQTYIERVAPPHNENLLNVFEEIPQWEEAVAEIRKSYRVLDGIKDQLPTTETIEIAEKAATRIRGLFSTLTGATNEEDSVDEIELPKAVEHFLHAATKEGASLKSLTPEVETWLRKREIADSFVIKVSSSAS